jgi:hypothetical protein
MQRLALCSALLSRAAASGDEGFLTTLLSKSAPSAACGSLERTQVPIPQYLREKQQRDACAEVCAMHFDPGCQGYDLHPRVSNWCIICTGKQAAPVPTGVELADVLRSPAPQPLSWSELPWGLRCFTILNEMSYVVAASGLFWIGVLARRIGYSWILVRPDAG